MQLCLEIRGDNMSVLTGFIILLMAAFLIYMFYRLFIGRKLITLITIIFQVVSITVGVLCFAENVATNNIIEMFFICFGVLAPGALFIYDYFEIIRKFKKHVKLKPEDYSLYYNMGITLYEMGRYQEAVEAYRNALEIKPDELEIKCHFAAALVELKKYGEAADAYKSVLRNKAEDSEIYYNLSMVYAYLKKKDIALDNLKRAIELNSEIKNAAKVNSAFNNLKNSSEFQEILL